MARNCERATPRSSARSSWCGTGARSRRSKSPKSSSLKIWKSRARQRVLPDVDLDPALPVGERRGSSPCRSCASPGSAPPSRSPLSTPRAPAPFSRRTASRGRGPCECDRRRAGRDRPRAPPADRSWLVAVPADRRHVLFDPVSGLGRPPKRGRPRADPVWHRSDPGAIRGPDASSRRPECRSRSRPPRRP